MMQNKNRILTFSIFLISFVSINSFGANSANSVLADRPLSSVRIKLKSSTVVDRNITVPCTSVRSGSCYCAINNYGSSSDTTFDMVAESVSSGATVLSNGPVHIRCASISAGVVTPTVGMLRAAFGVNAVVSCKFEDGTRCPRDQLQAAPSSANNSAR